MSDTAAFFASKKKKKAFKFNANLIDASSVTTTVHVEAPALSTDQDGSSGAGGLHGLGAGGASTTLASGISGIGLTDDRKNDGTEQWDDVAVSAVAASARKGAAAVTPLSSEVLDIKTIDTRRRGAPENIAEKLRVEETKAQLAAAREGMEREAARIKEEQEKKEAAAASASSGTGGAATGKWVPPQRRAGSSTGTSSNLQFRSGGKLDVQDEELFPDLASAEKILEQKEKEHQIAFKVPKKTPVGGGASWASKPSSATASSTPAVKDPPPEPPVTAASNDAAAVAEDDNDAAPVVEAETNDAHASEISSAPKVAPKKKKKKDLSSFKPGS